MKTLTKLYEAEQNKYYIQKRSKWWWLVKVDSDGNRMGLDGSKYKSVVKQWAKDADIKLEKEELDPID